MRKRILCLSLAAAGLLTLQGCASSKVGAACYVPYGVSGSCQITTVEPGIAPLGS